MRLPSVSTNGGVAELARRDVEEVRDVQALGLPGGGLAAALLDHPAPERLDQARVLGGGDELQRRHQAALGILPAHERLDAGDADVVLEVEHRWCMQDSSSRSIARRSRR